MPDIVGPYSKSAFLVIERSLSSLEKEDQVALIGVRGGNSG